MVKWYDPAKGDAFTAHLFRHPTALCRGGEVPGHEVLATYRTRSDGAPFAFCRDGLLVDPEAAPRHIPFGDIDDAGYYNRTSVERAKRARGANDGGCEPLSIRLVSGEVIDLPMEVRDDGMPDLLTIARLIDRQVTLHKSAQRRAALAETGSTGRGRRKRGQSHLLTRSPTMRRHPSDAPTDQK